MDDSYDDDFYHKISQFSMVDCVIVVALPNDVKGVVAWACHSEFCVSNGDDEITNYTNLQFLLNYAIA